jgi:pyruvate dehydrogenase E2 component (dihydrolipoamide acetyltransferase)
MAEAAGLDLHSVMPSGPLGEITQADVEFALARRSQRFDLSPSSRYPSVPFPEIEIADKQTLKGVRGIIADRMSASSNTTARVTLFMDADVTELVAFREKLKAAYESDWGFAPGYNELILKACACALRQFSFMNVRLNGDSIETLSKINIGIAVDTEKGLFVPVVRDIDKKDLRTVGSEFRKLVEDVRSNKILPESLTGGTFTITNLGIYDIDGFTPIINLPEVSILGIGRITSKPVVREEQIVIRKIMTLSLAFDHRLVDGAPAAKFLQYIKDLVEKPDEIVLTHPLR